MNKMYHVDRNEFFAWTEGVLLRRDENSVLCVNELACETAKKELYAGRRIVLTVRGRPFSYLKKTGMKYIEKRTGK